MLKKPRFYSLGISVYVEQHGRNRQLIFCKDTDYLVYLDCL